MDMFGGGDEGKRPCLFETSRYSLFLEMFSCAVLLFSPEVQRVVTTQQSMHVH